MTKTVFAVLLIVLATVVYSVATYTTNENLVASLDDKEITIETLTAYVDAVAGRNYQSYLKTEDGQRKLADFYIDRTLLLDHAKQTVKKDDTVVKNHSQRSVDEDVMLLSALLQKEVQDKVQITEESVRAYMVKSGDLSEKQVLEKIESEQKAVLMTALVEKVREGHAIKYF